MWVLWFEREFWAVGVDSKSICLRKIVQEVSLPWFEIVDEYWEQNLGKEWTPGIRLDSTESKIS